MNTYDFKQQITIMAYCVIANVMGIGWIPISPKVEKQHWQKRKDKFCANASMKLGNIVCIAISFKFKSERNMRET